MSIGIMAVSEPKTGLRSWFFVAALLLNTFFLLDPTDTYFGLGYKFAYLPFGFMMVASVSVVESSFRLRRDIQYSVVDALILGFIGFSMIGSIWYKTAQDVDFSETFLRMSMLASVYFPAKILAKNNRVSLTVFYNVLLWSGIAIFVMLATWRLGVFGFINQSNQNLFHEEIFVLACLPFLPVVSKRVQWLLLLVAVTCCVLTFKNTGFLIAGFVMFAFLFMASKKENLTARVAKLFLVISALTVVILVIYAAFSNSLPGGNIDTRGMTYGFRIQQFTASPIIGELFLLNSEIDVGWGQIYSHSDFLDILASGGVVGVMLFAVPIVAILNNQNGDNGMAALKVLIVAFLIVAALNPVLMNPKLAFLFWVSLGFISAAGVNSERISYE